MLNTQLTKGQITDSIGKEFTKFYIKYFGHGPKEIKTYIIDDILLVRIIDDFRPIERALLISNEEANIKTVKELYRTTRERYKNDLIEIIKQYTQSNVLCSHHDISTRTGERIEVFILDNKFI